MREIDLHESGDITSALEQLEKELFRCFEAGEWECRVIYGIGTGALATAVVGALKKSPMVIRFQEEDTGGSALVSLE